MAVIRRDEIGLYVSADGWVARPVFHSNFKTGDKAKTHQIPQSVIAGVGQDVTCKRGEYLERWVCTSMFAGNRPKEWSDKDATLFYGDTPMPIQREMFERAKRHVAGHKLGPRPYAFVKS
jgi:hypothetical protein